MNLPSAMVERLKRDVANSRRQMEPFRRHRRDALEEFVGSFYSDDGAKRPVPIPIIELGVSIYTSLLAPSNPQVSITTRHKRLKAEAREYELATNKKLEMMKLSRTLREWVKAGLFGMSILDVSTHMESELEFEGEQIEIGAVHAELIDFEDYIFDMAALRIEDCHYEGHAYSWRKDLLEYVPWMDADKVRKVEVGGWQFGSSESEKAAAISRGDAKHEDRVYPEANLVDIWLPQEGQVATFAAPRGVDEGLGEYLGCRDWFGPEQGRYHKLLIEEVPGQVMPLAMTSLWRPLHDAANNAQRKLNRTARRFKEITLVQGPATGEGEQLQTADDGSIERTNDTVSARTIFMGVPHPALYGFVQDAVQRVSWVGGGFDVLGGLSAQADTASQEQIIRESANVRVGPARQAVIEATEGVCSAIAWYTHEEPTSEYEITKRIPGTDLEIPAIFRPRDMQGSYFEFNYELSVHSAIKQTPAQRLATLTGLFQQFVMPLQEQFAQQGVQIDAEGLLRTVARLSGMSELDDMLLFSAMEHDQRPQEGDGQRKPPATNRTYTRVSRSAGPGPKAQQQTNAQLMAAAMPGNQ